MADKTPGAAQVYPGTKYKNMDDPNVTKTVLRSYEGKGMAAGKDTYLSGGKGQRNIKGEGQSGKSGGKMHPAQALEKGGKICKDGEYNDGGVYSKKSSTKGGK